MSYRNSYQKGAIYFQRHKIFYTTDYIDYPNSTTNIFKTYYNNNTEKQKYTTLPFKAFDCSSYFIGNTCKILFPNYNIKNTFAPTIIDCSIEDMHHIHSFLIDSCSSTTICIEAIQFNLRSGLLFYMPCSGKFYFFDINFTFSNFLQPILSTATKIRFLSIHSIPVYFMLSKLGFKHIYIESLINLFTCINEINYNIPFSMLFQLMLNISQPKEQDFYQFAMPLYVQLFEKLHTPVKEPSGYFSNLLAHYRNMNYFNHALSTAYDLSDVILELNFGVSGLNQYNYVLHYQEDKPIISHGILYSVTFPFIDSTDNTKDALCHTIISSVYALPYKCISHAKLLSVSHSGIMFFCTEDGDEFFDLLLNAARKVYKNMFKKMPIINTKKIIY